MVIIGAAISYIFDFHTINAARMIAIVARKPEEKIEMIKREQIIEVINKSVEANPCVYAFWLEGADASGLVDEYSDIDMWFDVEDGKENLIFNEIEKSLKEFGPLDFIYEQEQFHQQIRHKIYHIKNTPDTLLLDICIQSHSRDFIFTKDLPGEEVKIIFDKSNVIKFKELDEEIFKISQEKRIHHLKNIFLQESRVLKMIKRGHFIDAFKFYLKFILEPLAEVLRMRYVPKKQIFLKYISKDLPNEVTNQLETLYQIRSLEEMKLKIETAKELFKNALQELESK